MARVSGRSKTPVAIFAAVFIIVGVIASVITAKLVQVSALHPITASSSPSRQGSVGLATAQDIYAARLRKDVQSLDRGVLTYSPIGRLKTAAKTEFKVLIIDAGRGPQHGPLAEFGGMTVHQQDVPTGGIVGVQIVGCENLTCQQQSSPKQPVLVQGDDATWDWQITAGMPGPAKITLRVDTYDQGSEQILCEEIFRINTEVMSSSAYKHQQRHKVIVGMAKSIVGDILTIGSVATAILAIGGVMGWIVANRRKQSKTNRHTKDKGSQPTGSRIRRWQASNMSSCADRKSVRRLVRVWSTSRASSFGGQVHSRRAPIGPGLGPGPRRQARRVGRDTPGL